MIYDYFEQRESMVNAFVLIDSRHEPQKIDLEFRQWLASEESHFSIVFTKIDKLSSSEFRKNQDRYKKKLLDTWEEIPPIFNTSAESKHGQDEVLNYVEYCCGVYSKTP